MKYSEEQHKQFEEELAGDDWAGKLIAVEDNIKIPPGDFHYAHKAHLIVSTDEKFVRELVKSGRAVPYSRERHKEIIEERDKERANRKSGDMNADEAIAYIENEENSLEDVKNFLSEDEDRTTVERAYNKRVGDGE